MNYFCNLSVFYYVLDLGVQRPENDVSNAQTCSSDIGLYLYISKVHFLVSWFKTSPCFVIFNTVFGEELMMRVSSIRMRYQRRGA